MGLFDRFKKPAKPEPLAIAAETLCAYAPVNGKVVAMSEVPDPVFSSEALGPGCGVWPEGETVYAPVSGTVSVTMGHAMGLVADDGEELLVHVGVDTVNMKGEGFKAFVQKGDHVTAGQPLMTFSKQAIAKAGYKDVVVVAVSNASQFSGVELVPAAGSTVAAGDKLLSVSKA